MQLPVSLMSAEQQCEAGASWQAQVFGSKCHAESRTWSRMSLSSLPKFASRSLSTYAWDN